MQFILDNAVGLIALLYCTYVLASTIKFYFVGDKTISDESLMQNFIELERRKAIRARVPKKG